MVGTLSLGHAVSQPFLSSRKVFNRQPAAVGCGLRIELLASKGLHLWGQWTFAWVRFGPLGYPTGHHELVRARGSAPEQKKKESALPLWLKSSAAPPFGDAVKAGSFRGGRLEFFAHAGVPRAPSVAATT